MCVCGFIIFSHVRGRTCTVMKIISAHACTQYYERCDLLLGRQHHIMQHVVVAVFRPRVRVDGAVAPFLCYFRADRLGLGLGLVLGTLLFLGYYSSLRSPSTLPIHRRETASFHLPKMKNTSDHCNNRSDRRSVGEARLFLAGCRRAGGSKSDAEHPQGRIGSGDGSLRMQGTSHPLHTRPAAGGSGGGVFTCFFFGTILFARW